MYRVVKKKCGKCCLKQYRFLVQYFFRFSNQKYVKVKMIQYIFI